MKPIEFVHSNNIQDLQGPHLVLPHLLASAQVRSILDVGCGTATWLKAARDLGVKDVFGIDGIDIDPATLHIPRELFKVQDLTQPIQLGRKFDLALCLEVGEHLDSEAAPILVETLTRHADTVLFSAACPGQQGQHHVNGQWPGYWQKLFNDQGFACYDELRMSLWEEELIAPWYRQNLFVARRAGVQQAGREPRIKSMVHPEVIQGIVNTNLLQFRNMVSRGEMPFLWYLKLPFSALGGWLGRRLRRLHRGVVHSD